MLGAVALATIMVLTAAVAFAGSRFACLALAAEELLYLEVSQPVEGPTLLRLTADHGVTSNDLPALVGILAAGVLWRRASSGGIR